MQKTNITWTEYSSNPIYAIADGRRGWYCTHVSPGCTNCYAEAMNKRFGNKLEFTAQNRSKVEWKLNEGEFEAWRKLRKPSKIFVCDMTDLFHPDVPDRFIGEVFGVMAATRRHTYQVLTKRPERMRAFLIHLEQQWHDLGQTWIDSDGRAITWPLPNVWLGVSVENQETADERLPILLDTPAAVRWASVEPMLGPVDLAGLMGRCVVHDGPGLFCNRRQCKDAATLDWIVIGGESGPHHRPLDHAWVRAIREQCRAAGVAYFGKQSSGSRPGIALPGELGDREFPT